MRLICPTKSCEMWDYTKIVIGYADKNHTERILELNAKTLSQLHNGNQYRVTANGRIVKKDNRNDNPIATEASTTDDTR